MAGKYHLEIDLHTHSLVSGHAYGTIREMAQAAGEKGIRTLGITEHGPGTPGTCDPLYFVNLPVAPRKLYGVEILHGCELNVTNDGVISLGERYLSRLDYAIAGIHTVCYRNEGAERNTDHLLSFMAHEKVRFVSHPDDGHTPLDYVRLVKGARKYHVALEVNNSSFLKLDRRLNCLDNYRTMLSLCLEEGVPVIVSSDAHDPEYVGRFEEALSFLASIDFPPEGILNGSRERVRDFLGI